MAKFDQKKQKSMNRYEIIGVEKEALKVINQMFRLELRTLAPAMSNEKLWVDDIDTYDNEYQMFKCFYLNEADDLVFVFQNRDESNEKSYWLDLSVWNGSMLNPLKLIK
jgi:hypothetical protein